MNDAPLVLGLPLLHAAGRDLLSARYRVVELEDPAQIDERLPEADALYCYPPLTVSARMIERAGRLKVIAAAGSGVDHIDLQAAADAGIAVTHAVGAGALSVAEHAIGHMLCLAKRLVEIDRALREGRFGPREAEAYEELSGRTLAIVGFGAIGRALARIAARGFEMDVIAVTRSGAPVDDPNVRRTLPLRDALAAADVVSVHVPLMPSTRGLIGRGELCRMKPTAWLIDTSRGGVVDSAALHDMLVEGRLAGAGLDVFEPEPPPADAPLLALPNVVVSPHCAGITRAAYRRLSLSAANDIDQVLRGMRPAGLVVPPPRSPSIAHLGEVP
ncbi:NAD(P)-dependent oxidoreductase [Variovorax sp. PBL-E5]|uniref:NAD(P)-dependent oxidoreductase n=1 Tax=Variovorax sp. PBL-E5 TaxID=434014 RepID=UPI001315BC9B|nr:NAD(P)-dependent oxidoreductase [Variovorax sp. PBL-E5]VTU39955.1 Glycerate dehydrogenase [Variovorax sp. PBL-E5]